MCVCVWLCRELEMVLEADRVEWRHTFFSCENPGVSLSLSVGLDASSIPIRQLPNIRGLQRGGIGNMREGRDFPILWEDILLATLLLLLEQPAQHQVNPPWIFISWNLLIYSVRREAYLLHTVPISKPLSLSLSHSFLLWNFLQQRPDRFLTSHLAFPFTRLYNNIPSIQPHQWRFLAISHYSTRRLMTALHNYKLLVTWYSNIRMFQYYGQFFLQPQLQLQEERKLSIT